MISVKTINNQNAVINSVLGLDGNSNTIVNGSLTIQDTSGSLVITPSGIFTPTNTVLNNLTVNGTSTFTGTETHNGTEKHNGLVNFKGLAWASGNDFRVVNTTGVQGIQMYNSNNLTNNVTSLDGIGANYS